MNIPIFPDKYHQNGGFSWAMVVSGRVNQTLQFERYPTFQGWLESSMGALGPPNATFFPRNSGFHNALLGDDGGKLIPY